MLSRIAVLAAVAAASLSVPAEANYVAMSRREIRSMPITERPSRPGHFYGNTVRRNTGRRAVPANYRGN